jgi:hypothetical protein
MTQQHPITPPPELIQRWSEQFEAGRSLYAMFEDIYRAGADQELEACCEWLRKELYALAADGICAARRPKPPSLKKQAQIELDRLIALIPSEGALAMAEPIRRALEALDA